MLENLDRKLEEDLCTNHGFIKQEVKELLTCINYHCGTKQWPQHYALNYEEMKSKCLLLLVKEYPRYKGHRKRKRVNGMKWLIIHYIKSLRMPFRTLKRTPHHTISSHGMWINRHKMNGKSIYDGKRRMYVREFREYVLCYASPKTSNLYMNMINFFAGEDRKYGLKRDLENHMGCRRKGLETQLKELKCLFKNYFMISKDFSENSEEKLYYNSRENN